MLFQESKVIFGGYASEYDRYRPRYPTKVCQYFPLACKMFHCTVQYQTFRIYNFNANESPQATSSFRDLLYLNLYMSTSVGDKGMEPRYWGNITPTGRFCRRSWDRNWSGSTCIGIARLSRSWCWSRCTDDWTGTYSHWSMGERLCLRYLDSMILYMQRVLLAKSVTHTINWEFVR